MIDHLFSYIKKDSDFWNANHSIFKEIKIPAKTTLLREGEISNHINFIKKGCLRVWFNNDGKDITVQFFFENQAVASFESFFNQQPSLYNIESIEPTTLISISKPDFDCIHNHFPAAKDKFIEILLQRLSNYAQLFLSRIKDNPQKRYKDLLINHPEIIKRVPQHYIASYLGITPISLSRIRNKK